MSVRRGVLAFVLAVVVLGVLVVVAAFHLRRRGVATLAQPSVLVFDLPATLSEGALPARSFLVGPRRPRYTTYEVVRALDAAADDEKVGALVLHVDELEWGWAKLGEVREAVCRFRDSGKPVYASLTGGGEPEYLLASAADVVAMPPTAMLQLDGLSASATFFRGTFDKVGVRPNFVRIGRFKSAAETYTRTDMSPESRAELEAVLDDLYGTLIAQLGDARAIGPDSMARLVDAGPFSARAAQRLGLLDTLLYDAEVDTLAMHGHGRRLSSVTFSRYRARMGEPAVGPRIALVSAEGTIVGGRSRSVPGQDPDLGAETLIAALRAARTRSAIKAIVLRIDSPGGSAQASDDIWREVQRCRAVKPVIVSMSDLAASGGYYIAVAADSIVAMPTTLTGSIGIFGGKLNVLGLYRKLGLNVETVTRGRHAQMLSPFSDFTPEEAGTFARGLEEFYRGFVARVARGRRLSEAEVDSVAQGRVWSGMAARERGLVDRLGGIETAIEMARARAKIPPDEELVIEYFPRPRYPMLERIMEDLAQRDDDTDVWQALPPMVRAWAAVARIPAGEPLAIMPYRVEVR